MKRFTCLSFSRLSVGKLVSTSVSSSGEVYKPLEYQVHPAQTKYAGGQKQTLSSNIVRRQIDSNHVVWVSTRIVCISNSQKAFLSPLERR